MILESSLRHRILVDVFFMNCNGRHYVKIWHPCERTAGVTRSKRKSSAIAFHVPRQERETTAAVIHRNREKAPSRKRRNWKNQFAATLVGIQGGPLVGLKPNLTRAFLPWRAGHIIASRSSIRETGAFLRGAAV